MSLPNNLKTIYPFTTTIPVRITDINYGNHLGHIETIGIFHHARVLFLKENGFDEMNIDGFGLILLDSQYSFKSETKFNTNLCIQVGIGEFSRLKFNIIYQALNQETGNIIAEGREELVFFDYEKRKVSRISEAFLTFCNDKKVERN